MDNTRVTEVKNYLLKMQDNVCQQLVAIDGAAKFITDKWQKDLGEGITRVISNGEVFERGGVNFSHVQGEKLPAAASAKRPDLAGASFEALGVSLVMHPQNPFVPTSHANVRFFVAHTKQGPVWWFGGGYDLTPYYPFDEDCRHWHQVAKTTCDPYGAEVYQQYKQWCDDYFFLKHRNETRGIGGLFFDDVNQWSFEQCFSFMRSVGDSYLQAYLPIVQKRKSHQYTEQQRAFQLYRRGRYVEFNLIYDRGTLFGLQFGGRTESILMSMPPQASWQYSFKPSENSLEAKLNQYLQPRDWLVA